MEGGLVPFILCRHVIEGFAPYGAVAIGDGRLERRTARCPIERIRSVLGRTQILGTCGHAVGQPVGVPGHIAPAYVVDGPILPAGGHRVGVAPGRSAPLDVAASEREVVSLDVRWVGHPFVVESVGIVCAHGIEEFGVLTGSDLELADAIRVADRTVTTAVDIVRVAGVAHTQKGHVHRRGEIDDT